VTFKKFEYFSEFFPVPTEADKKGAHEDKKKCPNFGDAVKILAISSL